MLVTNESESLYVCLLPSYMVRFSWTDTRDLSVNDNQIFFGFQNEDRTAYLLILGGIENIAIYL